jgi:type I restriction enzyme M protein
MAGRAAQVKYRKLVEVAYSAQHSRIESFIWQIADDVVRDLYVRGKYRDVILPMMVLRRFDAVLESTKDKVLVEYKALTAAGMSKPEEFGPLLCNASGQAFYNTSPFTLAKLSKYTKAQQLVEDFTEYLKAFSPNVREILTNFDFEHQIPKLARNNTLGELIRKFVSPEINLSPEPTLDERGRVRLPALDNHAMGTIFENLVRRFNEENNEEAGEHWTPRDAVKLMAQLLFLPIMDGIKGGSYLLYDGACGTGGMLTVAEQTLHDLADERGIGGVTTHLYGQEINAETYAICKADLLIKGSGEEAENIRGGPEWSTLANDAFPTTKFDFMLANPPYGKSWKVDLERLGGKGNITDPRFLVAFPDTPEVLSKAARGETTELVTGSSDGQLMFLANLVSKMKDSERGSRIAEIHNGSSLFSGDAGSGESNIRRWIIENDWLEAVVALPLNMFYNTGIATYIWVLSNRKAPERRGKVQLVDATGWSSPLRKNLGKKNCELSEADMTRITTAYLELADSEQSKLFPKEEFGYWKITVERPLRLRCQVTQQRIDALRFASGDEQARELLFGHCGELLYSEFGKCEKEVRAQLAEWVQVLEAAADADAEAAPPDVPDLKDARRRKVLDAKTWQRDGQLYQLGTALLAKLGDEVFLDYGEFERQASIVIDAAWVKLKTSDRKLLLRSFTERDEQAVPVVLKRHKAGTEADPLYGLYQATDEGALIQPVIEYESDSELRDTEQVPLLEPGGIEAFFEQEVRPYVADAWINRAATKIGYEISFTKHFYKPPVLRGLDKIKEAILDAQAETDGLLKRLFGEVGQ